MLMFVSFNNNYMQSPINKSDVKDTLYIRNLKCFTFNTIFRQHNIHLVFTTCQHKYKWILCAKNQVLDMNFQDFLCSKNQ